MDRAESARSLVTLPAGSNDPTSHLAEALAPAIGPGVVADHGDRQYGFTHALLREAGEAK